MSLIVDLISFNDLEVVVSVDHQFDGNKAGNRLLFFLFQVRARSLTV